MKKYLYILGLAILVASCTKDTDTIYKQESVSKITPTTIYASVDDYTRTELHWEDSTTPRTHWSENDKIAVLNGSSQYNVYELIGQSGSQGAFSLIDDPYEYEGENFEIDNMVAFYPYTDSKYLYAWKSQDGERKYLTYEAPNIQTFVGSNTYGANVNAMIAVAEKNSTENVQFRNIFGYLRVTLQGEGNETIKKVILKGNNWESISGDITINLNDITDISAYGSDMITIDCGDGVALTEEGISFIFTLPPTNFGDGFTVFAVDDNYNILTLCSEPVSITQNVITPMPAVSTQGKFVAAPRITYQAASRIENDSDSYSDVNNFLGHSYSDGVGEIIILEDEIKSGIFSQNSAITSITINEGITSIDDSAFNGCPNLQSVSLPAGLTNIGQMAFNGCASLESIVIPEGVNSALYVAFADCPNLRSATIPGSLGDTYYAFARCSNLENVNLAATSTIIGTGMFSGCTKLKSITLYDNIIEIRNGAFSGSGLESIEIPSSVKKIYNEAFNNCSDLHTITFQCAEPPKLYRSEWNVEIQQSVDVPIEFSNVFGGSTNITTIYVPEESVKAYREAWGLGDKIQPVVSI